jgi:thiamine biosynthesis protein ThiS
MIRVNDQRDIPWHEGMTVNEVLAACNFTHHYVAVSINGTLVAPAEHERAIVADGDEVEVIHIIGGG